MKIPVRTLIILGFLVGPSISRSEDALEELIKKYGSEPAKIEKQQKTQEAPKVSAKPSRTQHEGVFHLQVASSTSEQEAKQMVEQLSSKGHPVGYKTKIIAGKTWYPVQVGPFPNRAAAKTYLKSMDAVIQAHAVVTVSRETNRELAAGKSGNVQGDRGPASTTSAKPMQAKAPQPVTQASEKTDSSIEPPKEKSDEEPEELGVFGDWGGTKTKLKEKGVQAGVKYKGETVHNLSGGLMKDSTYLSNLDVTFDFDLEKIAGAKGWNLFIYGLGDYGGHPSEFIGDSFKTSNIEALDAFKLYEAYIKKSVDDRFTMLLGLRDLNADYYATESSGALVNSAFGISPSLAQTGVNGPSIFPTTSVALSLKYESPSSYFLQAGVFNATAGDPNHPTATAITTEVENGYLYICEMGFAGGKEKDHYKYSVGSWFYSKYQSAIDASQPDNQNNGYYLIVDRGLSDHVSGFLKYGVASPVVNVFSSSAEVGFNFTGLIPGRAEDKLSLGYVHATVSKDFELLNSSKSEENIIEVSYQIHVRPGLLLSPDFQYVKNPGLAQDVPDAQVGSLRIEIQF